MEQQNYPQPQLPFRREIHGGACVGGSITIIGSPFVHTIRNFAVNLSTATGQIALHLNARFQPPGDPPILVLNSNRNGSWQQEQRADAHGTLNVGVEFTLRIVFGQQQYEIFLNTIHVADFQHRVELSDIRNVEITGEVILRHVGFHPPIYPDSGRGARRRGGQFGSQQRGRGRQRGGGRPGPPQPREPFTYPPYQEMAAMKIQQQVQTVTPGVFREAILSTNPTYQQGAYSFTPTPDPPPAYYHLPAAAPQSAASVQGVYGEIIQSRQPIRLTSPQLPFTHRFPSGFQPPQMVRIRGTARGNFAINFQRDDEKILHFNPRFNEKCVVRNSTRHGNWLNEEKHGGNPFTRKEHFTLEFRAGRPFEIFVNGNRFVTFAQRDGDYVNILTANGELIVHEIVFE